MMTKKIFCFSCALSVVLFSISASLAVAEVPKGNVGDVKEIESSTDAAVPSYLSAQKQFEKAKKLLKQKKLIEGVQWLKQAARSYHP
jgi:hypothetical protein